MKSTKPEHMFEKLARYEAEGKSTEPLYEEWSKSYESDLLGNLGYTGHVIAAEAFRSLVQDKAAKIIDIGCGTGLVGQELQNAGYLHIDGVDISATMLAEAKVKNIYRNLIEGDMQKQTSLEDAAYDALICAGSFAPGHLGPESYPEFLRLVGHGSPIVIFMNGAHFLEDGYEEHIRRLEADGKWELIGISVFNYMSALERPGRLIMARKC